MPLVEDIETGEVLHVTDAELAGYDVEGDDDDYDVEGDEWETIEGVDPETGRRRRIRRKKKKNKRGKRRRKKLEMTNITLTATAAAAVDVALDKVSDVAFYFDSMKIVAPAGSVLQSLTIGRKAVIPDPIPVELLGATSTWQNQIAGHSVKEGAKIRAVVTAGESGAIYLVFGGAAPKGCN